MDMINLKVSLLYIRKEKKNPLLAPLSIYPGTYSYAATAMMIYGSNVSDFGLDRLKVSMCMLPDVAYPSHGPMSRIFGLSFFCIVLIFVFIKTFRSKGTSKP